MAPVGNIASMNTTVAGRGTFPFMAPEFFAAKEGRGLVNGKFRVDASVDVFATGVVFAYTFGYNSGDYYGKWLSLKYFRFSVITMYRMTQPACLAGL